MKKNKITAQYSKIILILLIASLIMSFLTPLIIKAFYAEMFEISETGLDYIIEKNETDEEEISIEILDRESSAASIIKICCLVMLILPFLAAYIAKYTYNFKSKKAFLKLSLIFIVINSILSALYFLMCLSNLEQGVETHTYIPLLVQIALCAAAFLISWHCKCALSGTANPLFVFSDGNTKSARGELAQVDLLIKYKELLDKGIIDEEEFEKKRKELLTANEEPENEDKDVYVESARLKDYSRSKTSEPKLKWYKFLVYFWVPFKMFIFVIILMVGIITAAHTLITITSVAAIIIFILQELLLLKRKKAGVLLTYVSCFALPLYYYLTYITFPEEYVEFTQSQFLLIASSIYAFFMYIIYFKKRSNMFK